MMDADTVRVGIDVGGTKVATGLVNAQGKVVGSDRLEWREEIPGWRTSTAAELTGHMVGRLAALLERQQVDPARIQAVGLGFPGDFEEPNGRLKTIPNLPMFMGTAPVALFRQAFEACLGPAPPIQADNDAVVAVLAEAHFGAGRGAGKVLYLTVSTGVGGARFDGEHATNIEPGLTIFPDPIRPHLNLERLAGGSELAQRAQHDLRAWLDEGEKVLTRNTSLLQFIEGPGATRERLKHLTSKTLGQAAARGDAYSRKLFDEAAGWVAAGLAQILALGWGEECIVMGGSIAENVPGFLGTVRAELTLLQRQPEAPPGLATFEVETGLVPAALGPERGVRGAVLLTAKAPPRPSRQRKVRSISAAQARPLRQAILRPHQPLEACIYEADDDPSSAHFGAVADGRLVGIASIYRQREDGSRDPFVWRLRGMATLEAVRGQGYGVALIEVCVRHAQREGGMRLWCNARTTVAGFYRGVGFREKGEEFDLPGLGPHVVMELEL